MRLANGSRVVIVGGGPAGSFCALQLLAGAKQLGLHLEVAIYEGRDFSRPGPGGCNKCAGVLSSSLIEQMRSIGLSIPPELVQARLNSYMLHFSSRMLQVERQPEQAQILSVYRGSGPRLDKGDLERSFDAWLLEQACQAGATLKRQQVEGVSPGEQPVVKTSKETFRADLVVIASGVNSRSPLDPAWGYSPPRCEVMAQNEIASLGTPLDEVVHIYFRQPAGLLFGALVPKGKFMNISLLGEQLPPRAVEKFLDFHSIVQGGQPLELQKPPLLCGCNPKVAIGAAKGYYNDRMVVIGDAAVTRLYKNGIGSAFTTAAAAARCAVQCGVGKVEFERKYRPVCEGIDRDNRYGHLLFEIWKSMRDRPLFRRCWQNALEAEENRPPSQQIHRSILWHMFTGDRSYQQIFWQTMSVSALLALARGAA